MAQAEAMTSLIQTTIGAVLGPLIAEQGELRQTVERLSGQIARQSETIGQLRAENRMLLASTESQSAEPPTAVPVPRWRLLWPLWAFWTAVAFVIALMVVLVVRW
jgi:hypothetical protein